MKTEFRLANALKELMSENYPLNDISVRLLTKRCGVSRPTFYYHFSDIYDLVTLVFLNESIPEIKKAKNMQKVLACIYSYYITNQNFINVILNSSAKPLFEEFLTNNCYQIFCKILTALDEDKKLTVSEKKYIARFYSVAYASTITFYLENAKEKSLKELEQITSFVGSEFLQKSIKNMVKAKDLEKKERKKPL